MLGVLQAGDTQVRLGSPRGIFRHSSKDKNYCTEHPLAPTAGFLSDHLGSYLHAGARLISTRKEKFTNSVTISSHGHFEKQLRRTRREGSHLQVMGRPRKKPHLLTPWSWTCRHQNYEKLNDYCLNQNKNRQET